uniref:Rho GDP-dissociation inhibitor n=1 Tax=Peronospora matthiolae TaxID=2874970 RepID=A0AAV1T1J1_9STRA
MHSTAAKDASLVSVTTDESSTDRTRGRSRRCDDDTGMPVAYKVSANAIESVDELLAKDAEDESLRRYKERLLGVAAHGDRGDECDTRRVVVKEFKIEFLEDGNEDLVYKLSTPEGVELMRTTPFVLTESCRYRFVISFQVNKTIVSGLHFCTNVKKAALATHDKIVLGSYAPRSESYVFVFPRREWMKAPSGLFYRGKYTGKFTFIDDDHIKHLEQLYMFEIKRA